MAIKIGYVSQFAPNDRRASSGTNYKVAEQLSKYGEIIWLPINTPKIYRILELTLKAFARLFQKRIYFLYTKLGCNLFARSQNIVSQLKQCDIIFVFFNAAPFLIISTSKPIIYLTDATFPAMIDYYPPFCNLFHFNKKQGIRLEENLFNKFSAIVCSSDWAKKSVINDLNQNKEKVHSIEFGANLDKQDILENTFNYTDHLHILFLGVDWERKGGDIALKTCKLLNDNGIKTTLHIVGIKNLDDEVAKLPFVDNIGFLNKNVPQEYKQLLNIISSCHCLLLPTKAECAGIAFSEASAFGLPILTYNTGGISNYIIDGENGYALPVNSTKLDFYRKIEYCLKTGILKEMSIKGLSLYRKKLNWDHFGEEVYNLIKSLLK